MQFLHLPLSHPFEPSLQSFIHYSSSSFSCNLYTSLFSSLFLHPPLHSSFILLSTFSLSSSPFFLHPLASPLLTHFSLISPLHFSFILFFISPPSPPLPLVPLLQEPPQEANLKVSGMLPSQWSRRSRQPTPNSSQQ